MSNSKLNTQNSELTQVAFVLCGALAREVIAIARRHGWDVALFGVAAKDHMLPARIGPDVERRLRELIPRFARIVVVYGDCGTSGRLDDVLARYNVPRIAGPHCYEMYGGAAFESAMAEEPGTFFLTDFLVRGFEGTVLKGLGLDRFPELKDVYFANYRRLVYLVQHEDTALLDKARLIAEMLGLPLELRRTGYGLLEARLVALMAEIRDQRYQPVMPSDNDDDGSQTGREDEEWRGTLHGNLPDPLLARHPGAGAREGRRRARQRAAARSLPGGD